MAAATAHNGGRSQVNFGGIRAYGDYPFINMVKAAANWGLLSPDDRVPNPDNLDVNGYVTNGVGCKLLLFIPRAVDKSGEWILEWDGTGTFADWTTGGITGGSLTSSGTGFCKGIPYSNEMTLQINSQSSTPNHIRNIRFYHSSESTRFNTDGEIFGADFLARMRELNCGVLRFMDWFVSNNNNCSLWSSRKSLTHFSYYAQEFRGSAWGSDKWYFGTTTNSGNAYSITTGRGRAPLNGDVIQLYFNADATASGTCSLNADGFGAVNILDSYGQALSTGGNSYPLKDAYGTVGRPNYATLVYNSMINAWIKQGGDTAIKEAGLASFVPPELMVRLASELGAHPWFNAPILALDPMTDYVTSMATYVRDNSPSWMIPRYEPPNETFNNFGNFYNNGIARALGTANGFTSSGPEDYVNEYGKFASTMGQDLDTVYSSNRSKYVYLAGVMTATGSTGAAASNGVKCLSSSEWLASGIAVQSGYTRSAAKNYLHGIACANYFGPSNQDQPSEATMAALYAGGDLSQVPAYIALCYDNSAGFNIYRNQADFAGWKTVAQGQGLQLMEFYEGGFSPDYTGDAQINAFKEAAKYHPNLKQVLLDDYAICTGTSGGGFTARFPSHYYLSNNRWAGTGVPGTSKSVWSLLEDIYESPTSSQWQAIVSYNQPSKFINLRLRLHN